MHRLYTCYKYIIIILFILIKVKQWEIFKQCAMINMILAIHFYTSNLCKYALKKTNNNINLLI